MEKPKLFGAMNPPPEPLEYRVPKNLEVGMTVAITKSITRPWWAFWRKKRVTEFHQVSAREGQTFHFRDGGSIILPNKMYP